jgi:flagellar hook protein FlgE
VPPDPRPFPPARGEPDADDGRTAARAAGQILPAAPVRSPGDDLKAAAFRAGGAGTIRARPTPTDPEARMSLFGAMSTAITGLSAQSAAFGNISDNVANSQTVGYKRVDTNFTEYLSTSTASENEPGMVTATPSYVNTVQGTINQTDNPLAMAISGQGFFPISTATSVDTAGQPTFSAQSYYTRAGNFTLNQSGYIVNSAGNYLNGWVYNPITQQYDTTKLLPVQVSQLVYAPVPTSSLTLSANLPSGVTTGSFNSQISVYDSLGSAHQVDLTWAPSTAATSGAAVPAGGAVWQLTVASPDDPATASAATEPTAYVVFNANGTIAGISGPTPAPAGTADYARDNTAAATATTPNPTVRLGVGLTFAGNLQNLDINLGNLNQSNGMTQFGAVNNDYSLRSITQNGVAPGSFSSISTNTAGDIIVNYDNGQSRPLARVPVVTFSSPDSLQRQNGSAFTATAASGNPIAQAAGTNGAGSIVTTAVEQSNVDIATEFSQLIVAQQAYSANAKVVTTADTLLQTTIDMMR